MEQCKNLYCMKPIFEAAGMARRWRLEFDAASDVAPGLRGLEFRLQASGF